jgi:hypothetical protein
MFGKTRDIPDCHKLGWGWLANATMYVKDPDTAKYNIQGIFLQQGIILPKSHYF